MVDMRKRFRGNQPAGLSKGNGSDGGGGGGQLYGGRPAVSDGNGDGAKTGSGTKGDGNVEG